MSLMEQFANPATFDALSMGERVVGATVTMCMGLGITFCILLLLWAFIAIMAKFTNRPVKEKAAPAPAAAPAAAAPAPAAPAAAPAAATDNSELVAVIAAAIAAMEGKPVPSLVVKSITRVGGNTTAWSVAGLGDCIASRNIK